MTARRVVPAAAGVLLFLAAWKIASALIGMDIILPPPEGVLAETVGIVFTEEFAGILLATVFRALGAFGVAVLGAGTLGVAAGRLPWLERLLSPLMAIIRATPVISVILLALIWFHTGVVPVVVALLMIVPIIYGNVLTGIHETPTDLLEMAQIFRVPRNRVLRAIYLPALRPYLAAALETAAGITWKVIVAAEVLAQPQLGIGAELQGARFLLATSRVFAWTIVAVVVSGLFHLLLTSLLRGSAARRAAGPPSGGEA